MSGEHTLTLDYQVLQSRKVKSLTAENQKLKAEIERLKISHRRYETVRRMNVPQFASVFEQNIRTSVSFDEIIDDLAPFFGVD